MKVFYTEDGNSFTFDPNIPRACEAQNSNNLEFQNKKYDIIPHISVFPNKVILWNEFVGMNFNRYNLKEREKNQNKGLLSYGASKRLDIALNWLIHLAKKKTFFDKKRNKEINFKINFITLTLPSKQIKRVENIDGTVYDESEWHEIWPLVNYGYANVYFKNTDKEIKEICLNQFFVELRNRWKCRLYLWKAETQENGNIHFHIIFDKYIYQADLRDVWNRICNKLGYVDAYSERMSSMNFFTYKSEFLKSSGISVKQLAGRYDRGVACNWQNPNSTDVHSVISAKSLVSYLAGYIKKNDKFKRFVDGNLWRCSELLGSFQHLDISLAEMNFDEVDEMLKRYDALKFRPSEAQLLKNKNFSRINLWKIAIFLFKKNFKNSKIFRAF